MTNGQQAGGGAVSRRSISAAVGSAIFFAAAPGMVVGVVPWWITGWRVVVPLPAPGRAFGALCLVLGVAVLTHCFVRFVAEGRGTPAPVAPTDHLVVGGLYRHVRNPMYLAIATAIAGQALLFGSVKLGLYGLLTGAVQAAFVRWYEEPALHRRFTTEYDEYRHGVRGWWPRLRPWHPPPHAGSDESGTANTPT